MHLPESLTTPPRERRDVLRDDGSLAASGLTSSGKQVGYWEWYRRDGSLLRSGYFDAGRPVSVWTEFDESGRPVRTQPAESVATELLVIGELSTRA